MEHLNKDQQQSMHNALKRSGKIISSTKMTTDKTTELIKEVEERAQDAILHNNSLSKESLVFTLMTIQTFCREALAAFEQPAVREMTVEEVAKTIYGVERWCTLYHAELAAKALAKLGTIRVVEGANG